MMKEEIEVWGYRRNYEKAQEAYENGYVDGVATSVEHLVQAVKSGQGVFNDKTYLPGIFMMVVPAETVEDTLNETITLL